MLGRYMLHEQKGNNYKAQENTLVHSSGPTKFFKFHRLEFFDGMYIQLLTFSCVLSNNCWGLNQVFAMGVNCLCKQFARVFKQMRATTYILPMTRPESARLELELQSCREGLEVQRPDYRQKEIVCCPNQM